MSVPNQPDPYDQVKRVRRRIRGMPVAKQYEAQLQFLAIGLEKMALDQIAAFRAEIIARFSNQTGEERGVGDDFVELIDGHVALRQLTVEPRPD